jgi:CBS domain-containing protein
MDKEGVGCVVVVESGRPIGMLTDRELALAVLCNRLDPGAVLVGEIARRPVITIAQDATIKEATELMRRHAVRRLPLVDKRGKLTAIISSDDMMQLVVGELCSMREAVASQSEELGDTSARRKT